MKPFIFLCVALLLSTMVMADAELTLDAPEIYAKNSTTKLTSTVTHINYQTRSITLKNESGQEDTSVAPEAMRNFNQIRVGDIFTSERDITTSATLQKTDLTSTGTTTKEISERTKLGDKPGVLAVKTYKTRLNVTAINLTTHVITLQDKGVTHTLTINNPSQLQRISLGDQVEIIQADTMLIHVDTP